MVLQDWMQYLQGLPADVGAIPLLLCATKPDLPGNQGYAVVHVPWLQSTCLWWHVLYVSTRPKVHVYTQQKMDLKSCSGQRYSIVWVYGLQIQVRQC